MIERSTVSAQFTWKAIKVSRRLFSCLGTINMKINLDRHQSIHSFYKPPKMQLRNEQRIFGDTNYLRTRSFNEFQQLFEQSFRDIVSPTRMTIWKKCQNVQDWSIKFQSKKKIAQVAGEQSVHGKTLIFLKKGLSRIQEYQPEIWLGH